MGFVRSRVFKLKFDDPEFDGLEVKAKSVPLKQVLDLMDLDGADFAALDKSARNETVRQMLTVFADALVSWNYEEEDPETGDRIPVPANMDGLLTLDVDFAFQIVTAWQSAVMGVSGPLGKRSPSGDRSLEASLPMEPLSPNPPS